MAALIVFGLMAAACTSATESTSSTVTEPPPSTASEVTEPPPTTVAETTVAPPAVDRLAGVDVEVYDESKTYANSENPYGPMHPGFISTTVETDGSSRELLGYSPPDSAPLTPAVLVLAPDGMTARDMAGLSTWTEVADTGGFHAAFLESAGDGWNVEDPTDDIAYIDAVIFDTLTRKKYVNIDMRKTYVVGYGEGGTIAHQLTMAHPGLIAGFVSVGGSDVPDAYMNQVGNTGSQAFIQAEGWDAIYEDVPNNTVPVPVWIIDDDPTSAVVEYWKSANNAVDAGLTDVYGGSVFPSNPVNAAQLLDAQPVADTRVSTVPGAAESFSSDLTGEIWAFLGKTGRYLGDPNGSLRAAYAPEDLGMEEIRLEVDGLDREFWVYAPSGDSGEQQLPLVVALHGFSSTAQQFATDTEWWRVAEERGFVVAFLQAYPWEDVPDKQGGVPFWNSELETPEGAEEFTQKDIDFVIAALDHLEDNYNVDPGRRFVTGHSNGGAMVSTLADRIPEMFAAAAPIGGQDVPFGADPNVFNDSVKLAYYGMAGDNDYFNVSYEPGDGQYEWFIKASNANSFSLDDAVNTLNTNGRYWETTYYYPGTVAPIIKYAFVADSPHSWFPEQSWKLWDEFFSKYQRSEDGTLSYEGIVLG